MGGRRDTGREDGEALDLTQFHPEQFLPSGGCALPAKP
jgi:hypothetical protein